IYVEPSLTMKPYVYVIGAGDQSTVINVSVTTDKVIVGTDSSGILSCTITGATGTGGIGVYLEGLGTLSPFLVRDCIFGSNDTLAQAHGATDITILQIDRCRMGGATFNFTNGFVTTNVGTVVTQLSIINIAYLDVVPPVCTAFASASGVGTGIV